MPPAAIQLMQSIQALMLIAPDVIRFSAKAKDWVQDLFSSGIIDADTQNALNSRVNDLCRDILSGKEPEHWKVQADPS